MDRCNLFTYNPLAPDYLNGIEDTGTPAGFVDLYSEFVYDVTLAAAESRVDRISFDADFLVLALCGFSFASRNGVRDPVVRLSDPDGSYSMNTKMPFWMVSGVRGNETPWFPTCFVPLGKFITIEAENTDPANPQLLHLIFEGVRRWKV